MKLDPKYKIEAVASSDPTLFVLTFVHISDDKKSLVATDGRALAIVPVEIEKNDVVGNASITVEALKVMRKVDKWSGHIALNGAFQFVDGSTLPRPSDDSVGRYPQYQQLIPKDPVIKHRITLNPTALLNLAKALGDDKSVTLEFQDGENLAIIARNEEAMGLLMPIKEK